MYRLFKLVIPVVIAAILLILIGVGCQSKPAAQAAPGRDSVKVNRIVDGDTLEIEWKGKKEKIRLIGVDTPETKKPGTPVMYYGKEASEYTKKRLEKQTVQLEWDVDRTDRYDRLLAYVWIGDELFNSTLVKEGYARIATFPPNVKYVDQFKKDQEAARSKKKGIWKKYEKAFEK
jgi:micrococcal nuclease